MRINTVTVLSNCFHHLDRLHCNQEENEFTLALACVLEKNRDFAKKFLEECGYNRADEEFNLKTRFQWASAYGIPDLALEVRSGSKTQAAIHVEVKVGLEPTEGQIERHLKGLENRVGQLGNRAVENLHSRLIVLSRHRSPQFSTPPGVKWLSWDRIHDLLRQSGGEEPVSEYLSESLAKALEGSEMVDFGGFSVPMWKTVVTFYEDNRDLVDKVEKEADIFMKKLEAQVEDKMGFKTSPYDILEESVHDKGRNDRFWIGGKEETPIEDYHVAMKIEPWEGWIETSVGAEGSPYSAGLLENLKAESLRVELSGWGIWHKKGGHEDIAEIDDFERVIEYGPKNVSLIFRRHLMEHEDLFGQRRIMDVIVEDFEKACEVLRRLS